MNNNRKLKIQPRYVFPKWKNKYIVPKLTISGAWLQLQGFEAFEHVTISILEKGKLLVTLNQ